MSCFWWGWLKMSMIILTFFPTCQVRVVRFYVSLFSSSSSSSASSSASSSVSLSDLNHDLVSSVWRVGPQPGSCEFSVACRTSTASSWVQCGVPGPNRELVSSVWRAGPQPRARGFSVASRTSTSILWVQCGVPDLNRDPVSSVWRPGPQVMCQKEWQKLCQKECQKKCQKDMSERMSKDMSERCQKECQKICQKECQKICQKECQKICHQKECQKICQKECQKICQKDVRKNVRRYVRKNVRRYVRKNVRRYVRQNVRKYVPSICAYIDLDNKNSCLHQRNLVHGILFFVWFGTLQQVLLAQRFFVQASEFGLAAMAEVVVECPETIFIGTANRFAKGVEHVWRYKLTFVGAERMYVCMEPPSTTHAGDLMFIMEEVVEGNKWYVAYEGRPVSNAEGEQELEKRAAVFRTSASFWEDGVHEWETNDVRSRATYTEVVEEPQWQASGFMVCTRHEM